MKYSQVVAGFYRIYLEPEDRNLLDIHFTAAAHHWQKHRAYSSDAARQMRHSALLAAHLFALKRVVYERGDFSSAADPSGSGLHKRSNWEPNLPAMPDSGMFDDMPSDSRYDEEHPNDSLLSPLDPHVLCYNRHWMRPKDRVLH